eukprot:jgi/Chrzof1/4366/Cz14g10150.t1
MPLGNPNVWKKVGLSYHDITTSKYDTASSSGRIDPSTQPVAGRPHNAPVKGAGTGLLQTTWRLTAPDIFGTKPVSSMTKAHYRPPPPDHIRQEPVHACPSQFPKPSYPNDYKTTKQLDYQPNVLQRAGPPVKGHKVLGDSGSPIPSVIQPDWTTQTSQAFKGWSRPEVAAAAAHTAGQPISNKSQYNIITGGPPMTNFVFESWDAKHDYRKTR